MHKIVATVLIVLCSIAPAYSTEVYRCFVEGFAHYQDKPCSGIVMNINTDRFGVSGLRDSEVSAYLDAVERDVYRMGPSQVRQLETVNSHLTILRRIVD